MYALFQCFQKKKKILILHNVTMVLEATVFNIFNIIIFNNIFLDNGEVPVMSCIGNSCSRAALN